MDPLDENAVGLFYDFMLPYPAAYLNNMSNRELYGWFMFEMRCEVPVADPVNLSDEFKARASAISIDRLPAGDPTTWVLPADTQGLERLKSIVTEQLDCHFRLRKDGCVPWFDSSQVQHVVYNTKDQPSITELWRGKYDDGSRVLSKQLLLWNKFRFWQKWRREQAPITLLQEESRSRLVNLRTGGHLSLLKLQPKQSTQTEATTLLEYLDFIDRYYASSHALVQSCEKGLRENCVCEQNVPPKRGRYSTKRRKSRAAGAPKGRACVGKCKERAVANLENAKRTLELRNAIWGRTVNQLNECNPNTVEYRYPAAPLETQIQTEDAGSAVLPTHPAQDLHVEK
ncbi:hypothetical protein X797_003564 [Metarhizium robertsii]|uniref:Uncharacterized protein n=2 Tax=Metarhizium robertsii TaxID=568076 RepID=E9EUU2_METRA|nr:uncharacterized protein MAA_03791 [Metarhizium robertsii ARSEF 23]EFZ01195.2 hypothetical protein MAA_03791 [Metarhizium robertsii ARSEF 23]EXV03765.1 hypothetical protein X797_003564 [Metarhizium robertsii]